MHEHSFTYVVVGATGAVGKVVADLLSRQGHQVRPVSRRTGISLDDPAAMVEAFHGADGAFLMIPFDQHAHDLHRREEAMAATLAHAVEKAALRRVVLLSGTSVRIGTNIGSGTGAAIAERHLDGLDIPERVYLRGGFFMENHLNLSFVDQAATGLYATPFRPDFATPMIAAADIGRVAADALTESTFTQPRVRELLGAQDYTMVEATRILGTAIGRPDLRYLQIPFEMAQRDMLAAGMSASFIDAVLETARTFNDGIPWAGEARSESNTTPTTLTEFANQIVRPLYERVHTTRP
ncbi:NmrA family NAD(P)-binding protein [Nonomuraea fuscirosea]|uniref:NmrA family NAD(P)-binding protein n=1 Tax=Nonomuraea fuscirosea TaxID=1291556 RepID=UPI0033F653F3